MLWSIIAVMLVALGLSATAAWLAFSSSHELQQLSASVDALQERLNSSSARDPMRTELRTLGARVNELAVVIEGPMSHLRESNEGALADIEQRLSKLENSAVATKPLVSKPTPKSPVAAAPRTKSVAASSQGWAINLISLTSEKDADEELARLHKLGVRAEKQKALKDGKVWYRLRVPGFTSYEGAKAYVDTVEKKAGVKNAWVAKE
jgi:cell division septation protein DedD